jgi:hypothetical protein
MLQSVKNSIKKNARWGYLEPEEIEYVLKIAKLLKKNQWIKIMDTDFVLNYEYRQSKKAYFKPNGAYFSKGDWLVINSCTEKLAIVDINDSNILTLKNVPEMLKFANKYGTKPKNRRSHTTVKIYWDKVAEDYDGIIIYEQKKYEDRMFRKGAEACRYLHEDDIGDPPGIDVEIRKNGKLSQEYLNREDVIEWYTRANLLMKEAKKAYDKFNGEILDKKWQKLAWATGFDVTTLVLFNTDPIKTVNMLDCSEGGTLPEGESGDIKKLYKNLRKLLKK